MKNKKIVSVLVFITIIFTVVYLIVAEKPLAKEYQFIPQWKINTTNPVIENAASEEKIHFHLGQTLGYFTEDGNITLYKTFPNKVSISDKYFAVYASDAKDTVFYDSDGTEKGKIKCSGFPYFYEDLIYCFLPGGNSFCKCNENGDISWKYEGINPITAFNTRKEFSAAGFADGTVKVFNNENGNIEFAYAPGGSDYPVILGVDISDDGKYIATVSGQNKQRFVVAHKENGQPKIVYHTFLCESSPYQTLVHFCLDNNRIIYNYENKIGIFDLKNNKNYTIPVESKILSIRETENLTFLLGKENNRYTVYQIENTNLLEGKFSFEAEHAFIETKNNCLYIGKDSNISKIFIERD